MLFKQKSLTKIRAFILTFSKRNLTDKATSRPPPLLTTLKGILLHFEGNTRAYSGVTFTRSLKQSLFKAVIEEIFKSTFFDKHILGKNYHRRETSLPLLSGRSTKRQTTDAGMRYQNSYKLARVCFTAFQQFGHAGIRITI